MYLWAYFLDTSIYSAHSFTRGLWGSAYDQTTRVDWKVLRLTKKELCHSNETGHALNSTYPDTNCIVFFQINPHWMSTNSWLWRVVLETFRERPGKLTKGVLFTMIIFFSCWGTENCWIVPNQENMEGDQPVKSHSHTQHPLQRSQTCAQEHWTFQPTFVWVSVMWYLLDQQDYEIRKKNHHILLIYFSLSCIENYHCGGENQSWEVRQGALPCKRVQGHPSGVEGPGSPPPGSCDQTGGPGGGGALCQHHEHARWACVVKSQQKYGIVCKPKYEMHSLTDSKFMFCFHHEEPVFERIMQRSKCVSGKNYPARRHFSIFDFVIL